MLTSTLRFWILLHKWTSLACTAFLLIICVTGLPLIFGDEIDQWLNGTPSYEALPATAPRADLDHIVDLSRAMYPGQIVTSLFVDDDEPKVIVSMAPSWIESERNDDSNHWIKFDARTARVLEQSKPPAERAQTFMGLILRLHMDLFAELPGELFLALMALLFVAAIVSGLVIYAPFMRKLAFGTVRRRQNSRLKWLDLHNLLGVVVAAWTLVVGATGIMNELSTPLFALWQRTDVQAALEPWRGQQPPSQTELSSVQSAFDTAKAALPGMTVLSVLFPGAKGGSPYHYLLWAKGQSPLMSRLFNSVLVDARSGALTAVVRMPWYLRVLEVSRPLHFGDYGGLPLKFLWAALDLISILILGSGLYLWLARRGIASSSPSAMALLEPLASAAE